jgi:hypothetical protein
VNAARLLTRLLELAGDPTDHRYVLALAGEGLDAVPEMVEAGGVRYPVARPTSELALRRLLWKANGAPFLAIIPTALADRLPPDLLRSARGERVHALDPTEVLSVVLGTHVVGVHDAATQQLALERLEELRDLLAADAAPPTVVDARLLDELLADVTLGHRLHGLPPGQLLVALLQRADTWRERERAVWRRHLPLRYANEGRVLAWALGAPGGLRAVVVRGALLAIEPAELPPAVWGPLEAALYDPAVGLPAPVLRPTVARLALDALAALAEDARPYLDEAGAIGRQLLTPATLAQSSVLPLGLENHFAALARQAAEGLPVSASEVEALKRHRAAPLYTRDITLITELARLSRYLALPPPEPATLVDDILAYQRDGAFADLTAARLRQALSSTARFHGEAAAVLTRWRVRRDHANQVFAQRLAAGYERAIHDPAVTPLHRVWASEVLPQLGPDGVFVVVMDGCSYPVFLQILYELGREPAGAIGLAVDPATGTAIGRPALALLPSITSHSRSAIFLGQVPHDPWVDDSRWRGEREAASDPARFNANTALGDRTRRLFLKGGLADGGAALLAALGDASISVVAAVFNAVDDQIGSSNTGAPLDVQMDRVTGFLPAVKRALEAGRQVLFLADHGHTPFDSTARRVGAGPTSRYAELAPGEAPPDGFIEIDLAGLGGATGRHAFAWRMSVYRGMPQVGYHGGCSPEELVVPMAWLVNNGVPADEPIWWFGGPG